MLDDMPAVREEVLYGNAMKIMSVIQTAGFVISGISIGVLASAIILYVYIWKTQHLVCPCCHAAFKIAFISFVFLSFNKCQAACPHCGKKGVKKIRKDDYAL